MTLDASIARIDFDQVVPSRIKFYQKNAYYYRELRNLVRFLVPEGAHVLEIGCFNGDQLASLKPKRGVGVDFSQETIDLAKKNHPELDFRVRQIDHLELNETFDYVVVNNLIGYANDLQVAFEQIRKVCRPDTKVILIYHSHLWRPLLKLAEVLGLRIKWPDQHWLSTQDLKNLLALSDLRLITMRHQFLFPFNIPLIGTFFNRFLVHLPFFRALALNHILIFQPT